MDTSTPFNWKPWLLVTLVVFILDQLTKHWILANMPLYSSFEVFSFFNIVHVHNYGAAFSFLSDQPGWQRWFLTGITSIISVVLLIWLTRLKTHEKLLAIALVFVLGGAFGNLYDRVVYGYVVDFIDWHYGGYHWPAFNLADAAITLGAILLIIDTLTHKAPESIRETKS